MKPARWLTVISGVTILGIAAYAIAEDVTLTTYYPSPRGVYEELRTTNNTYLATDAGGVGVGIDSTTAPETKLEVDGVVTIDPSAGGNSTLSLKSADANVAQIFANPLDSSLHLDTAGSDGVRISSGDVNVLAQTGSVKGFYVYEDVNGDGLHTPDELRVASRYDGSNTVQGLAAFYDDGMPAAAMVGAGATIGEIHVCAPAASNDPAITDCGFPSGTPGDLMFKVDQTGNLFTLGNVGIGTDSPAAKLDVRGGRIYYQDASPEIRMKRTDNSNRHVILLQNSGGAYTGSIRTTGTQNADLEFRLGPADPNPANLPVRLSIENNGDVGIGIDNPAEALDVQGHIRMRDGNQANGKVMTSDANGTASWSDPPTAGITTIKFRCGTNCWGSEIEAGRFNATGGAYEFDGDLCTSNNLVLCFE